MVSPTADAQRRGLRRARLLAASLLLVAAAIFLATSLAPWQGFWVGLLGAAAEAALVGGLADWFAVTALFRRPLGLPIPHTAIIPASRARIAEGIGRFIAEHFLEPDLVVARLRRHDTVGRAIGWLARPHNAAAVAERIRRFLPRLLAAVDDRDLRTMVLTTLETRVAAVDLAPLLGRTLRSLQEAGEHHALLDHMLGLARQWVIGNRAQVLAAVTDRSRWWVPRALDARMADALVAGFVDQIDELARPGSDARRDLDRWIASLVAELPDSPRWRAAVAQARDRVLADPTLRAWLAEAAGTLRAEILRSVEADPERVRRMITRGILRGARRLRGDTVLRARIERRVEAVARAAVSSWREAVGGFVADIVRAWEIGAFVERIELAVGRDLQYVRVNGTVVGAAVGMALYLVRALLP